MKNKLKKLMKQKALMTEYLKLRLSMEDFHGCWDAAVDLHTIQTKIEILKEK